MSSQHSQVEAADVQDLLLEASQWTDEETQEKLPATLPVVINFLRGSPDAGDGVQVARFTLGSFLPHLQVDQEAFKLLNCILPALQDFFASFIEKCVIEDEDSADTANQTLRQCILIIECCLLAVQFLTQAESVRLENVENLPRMVLQIVNGSLRHCSLSKEMYGDYLQLVGDSIAELCHQTVDLSTKFANLLSKILFDTFSDDDLDGLIFTCEQLCITASFLSKLSDLRAFVTVWRVYASTVCQHHSALITSLDTAAPLEALVKEIQNGFQILVDLPFNDAEAMSKTQKIMQRTIKTINFCLKIVVSLCEKFRGYLRAAHFSVGSLLLLLFRFSPGNVVLQKFPDQLKKEIESQTTIGIEPLLLHLRHDEDFVKTVFDEKEKLLEEIAEDTGSYLLLLVAVSIPPSATVMIHVEKFFSTIFATMQKSHASLSLPCTMDGVMCRGRQQSRVSLYEHILTRMCVLTARLDGDQFSLLEEILIQWLLSGLTWPALLAADMWSFIARYGTSELCFSHCLVLLDVLTNTTADSHQHVVTASLLSRLISKLTDGDREKFMRLLKEKRAAGNMDVAVLFGGLQIDHFESRNLKNDLLKSSTKNIASLLSRSATVENFVSLKRDLDSFPQALFTDVSVTSDPKEIGIEKQFVDSLAKLWNRMPEKLIGATVVDQMISSMIRASIPVLGHFSSIQLYQILSFCKGCTSRGTSEVCLEVSSLVAALGHISVPPAPERDHVLRLISECLSSLLKSHNPLVYQCALGAFVTFGKHTVHEMVLPKCLEDCSDDLQEKVTNFLKQEPLPIPTGHTRLSLLQQQVIDDKKGMDASKEFIRVNDIVGKEKLEVDSILETAPIRDERGFKRKRPEEGVDCESPEVLSVMRSLRESQKLLNKLNCGHVPLGPDDKSTIRKCLQEMLQSLDRK